MDKHETEQAIAIMQAYVDGKKIQYCNRFDTSEPWRDIAEIPVWNWPNIKYRIAPELPSIDWAQIPDEFKWLAVDKRGSACVFTHGPHKNSTEWLSHQGIINRVDHVHKSFNPGNCDWTESLIMRPE